MTAEQSYHWKFQGLPEFTISFADKFQLNPAFKATTLPGLGLIDKTYETDHSNSLDDAQKMDRKPWENFESYVEHLNSKAARNTNYKVLYITRHGLGYHNVFEARVGKKAWNDHWSHLDGDGKIVWADSRLNEEGKKQVVELGKFWSKLVTDEMVPLPGAIYTSPLTRCLETTRFVFRDVLVQNGAHFQPIIKELLRERLTDHTCDRRSNRSWITKSFPDYIIEPGLSEEDRLWTGGQWETAEAHAARKQQALEDIFNNDSNHFIALTTHSYAISAILSTLGMQGFRVREGSSIAILVKAERIDGDQE